VILASSSPRRALLLRAARFDFDVVPPNIDETPRPEEPPAEYVLRVSEEKTASILLRFDDVVLGADTTVVLDGRSIGKPVDRDHAIEMLSTMVGRAHSVLTGWTVRSRSAHRFGISESRVSLHARTVSEIAAYVDRSQPFDKAGEYALQGDDGWLVSSVAGSRSNVMGLPIGEVVPALVELGVPRSAPDGR